MATEVAQPRGNAAHMWELATRRARRFEVAKSSDDPASARAKIEEERLRWATALGRCLFVAGAPAARQMVMAFGEQAAPLHPLAGRRRGRALRQRLRVWLKVAAWLHQAHGVTMISSAMQAVKYLELRASEPCGRTVRGGILS